MKLFKNQKLLPIVCGLIILSLFSVPACRKTEKIREEKVKLSELKASLPASNAPYDTVTVDEANNFLLSAITAGGMAPFDTAYAVISPQFELASLFTAINVYPGVPDMVALYVPLALNWQNGKRLTMIVMKEHGFLRGAFIEDIPNWTWLTNSNNYATLSGIKRFFKYNGTLIKALQVADGITIAEIPPGTSSQASPMTLSGNRPGPDPDDWIHGPDAGDEDDDNDGIANKLDYCPFTEAGVWVDPFGCPLTMNLEAVTIKAPQNSFPVIPPFDFNSLPPIPQIPLDNQGYPGSFTDLIGGGGTVNVPFLGLGNLCGHINFVPVGNGVTANVKNLGQTFNYLGTDGIQIVNVVWSDLCVQMPTSSANQASSQFINAFNWGVILTIRDIDKGVWTNPSAAQVKAKLLSHMEKQLRKTYGGYFTISNGPCSGSIPDSEAKYVRINGDCN